MAPFATELLLAAMRGDEPAVAGFTNAATAHADSSGQDLPVTVARLSQAILYNSLCRYEDARTAAQHAASAPGDLFSAMWALPELVEAATRLDETDVARAAFDRLAETTQVAGTDYGLGIEARSRALLHDGDEVEPLYREAIDRLRLTHMRSELARAHLLYGEWLRRAGRRRDAREQLRRAEEMLAAMGMAAFAERARRELGATGEKVRRRAADARDTLTAQEAQIAGLARDGLSNAEIAARLFLSPRTVEWHLKNVFTKLDISSRRELRGVLPRTASGTPST
jgi:DNA-binding CsgD family transcriptional regulator